MGMRPRLFFLSAALMAVTQGLSMPAIFKAPRLDEWLPPQIGHSYGATYYYEFWNGGRYPPQDPATFAPIAAMGAGWTRIDFNRFQAYNQTGPNPFQTLAKPFLNEAIARGLKVVIVLIDDMPPVTPLEFEEWEAFVRDAVTNFKTYSDNGQIVWECWNEPNNKPFWGGVQMTNPVARANEYMAVLRSTNAAIRSVSPNALISGPAMGWGEPGIRSFFIECRNQGLEDLVDFISIHPNKIGDPTPSPGYRMLDPEGIWGRDVNFPFVGLWHGTPYTLKDLFALFPNTQFAVTEWPNGCNGNPSPQSTLTPHENQTATSIRSYLISLSEGLAFHIQWEFQEEKAPEVTPEDPNGRYYFLNMGIRNLGGQNRPVYNGLRNFLTPYRGWTVVKLPQSAGTGAIVIESPGAYRLVIQSPDTSSRRTIRWGAAGNSKGYPEMPIILPGLVSVTPSQTTMYSGTNTLTIRASWATPENALVKLSDNSGSVSTPASMTMPTGTNQVSVNVHVVSPAVAETVTVNATMNDSTKSATFPIHPRPELASLAFPTGTVTGGTPVAGTVRLTFENQGGGQDVEISDSSPSVTTPASVTVANGAIAKSFFIQTVARSVTYSVVVKARLRAVTRTFSLTVQP